MGNKRLDAVVEMICQRGCGYVNLVLDDPDVRSDCLELCALDRAEQHEVIRDLKTVMSVYDETGSCDLYLDKSAADVS